MNGRAGRRETLVAAAGERQRLSISQREKATRWDFLISMLKQPGVRDVSVRHLSAMRRAVTMLLANQEELPESLTAELKSYKTTLDELHLEAMDGFADVEGVINFLPTYVTESLVGEICRSDSTDDELSRYETVLMFCGPSGVLLRRNNFGKMSGLPYEVRSIVAEGLHFPRPTAHRQPVRRQQRGQTARPHGPHGPRLHPGSLSLNPPLN